MLELQRLRDGHRDELLAFELENRNYFARSISDRGDDFYARFSEHLRTSLTEQEAGVCVFCVLVENDDGTIVGRFNLYDLVDGVARVGYRVAERVAGQGVATSALRDLCRRAAAEYGLHMLNAETSHTNVASQRVLEKAGFVRGGDCAVGGKPGVTFTLVVQSSPRNEGLREGPASEAMLLDDVELEGLI